MAPRLHRGGRTRAWIGRSLGGDEALGDRVWRRCLHLAGGFVLLVYVLPRNFFLVVPTDVALVLALAMVLSLELLRHAAGLQMPTIRDREQRTVASFAFFAIGLSLAVLVFPRFIAIPVVLGVVLVDPLLGELRVRHWPLRVVQGIGVGVYLGIAAPLLALFGGVPILWSLAGGLAAAVCAVALEGPEALLPLDDDLTMSLVPGLLLTAAFWASSGSLQFPAF